MMRFAKSRTDSILAFRCTRIVSTLLSGLAFALGASCSSVSESDERSRAIPSGADCPRLERAIEAASDYLIRACLSSGRFVYRVHLAPRSTDQADYNVLRHAGAIYALGMYVDRSGDAEALEVMLRAGRYFRDSFLEPLEGDPRIIAVWSRPEQTGSDPPIKAKLGGAGLGLIALGMLERQRPGSVPLEELRGLARFVLFMQSESGEFCSRFIPASGGKDWSWTSLYYPGEAALGLLVLYEIDPDPRWVQGAANALAYLARIRAGEDRVPNDHWALLATARLLPVLERCPDPPPRQLLIDHAVQVCRRMLDDQVRSRGRTPVAGCFTRDGRTTPTATRLEGLLAARGFLGAEDPSLAAEIDRAVAPAIGFLLDSLQPDGFFAGAIPRALGPLPEEHPSWSRSFNRRADEVRIDYVQHAASALMRWSDLQCARFASFDADER